MNEKHTLTSDLFGSLLVTSERVTKNFRGEDCLE